MSRLFLAVLAASLLLLLSPRAVTSFASPSTTVTANDEHTFDLDFAGGTIAEYVKAILRVRPDANVVIMPEAAAVPMPALQLRAVDLNAALSLVDDRMAQIGRQWVQTALREHPQTRGSVERVFTIVADSGSQPAKTQVHSVVELLSHDMSSDDMMTAIETTLELLDDAYAAPKIRFHPETGIIIVRGHPDQVEAVDDVIGQLHNSVARQRRNSEQRAEYQRAQERFAHASRQKLELEDKLSVARVRITELEARNDVLQHEIARLHQRLDQLEMERLSLREELNTTLMQLEAAKKNRQGGGQPGE